MDIKTRIMTPAVALTLVVAAAILVSNIVLFSDFVDRSTAARVDTALKIAIHHLDDLKMKAVSASLSMSESLNIIDAIDNNDRDDLLLHAQELQEKSGIEFCTITDSLGNVIARTHDPEITGDSVASQITVKSAMAGKSMTAVEKGSVVLLSIRSAMPIFNKGGAIIGVVSVGYRLDTENFVDTVKDISGCESTVILDGIRIATTVRYDDGTRATGTKTPSHIIEMLEAGIPYTGEADILGHRAITSYHPVAGPDGRILGALFSGQPLNETGKTIQAFVQSGLTITIIVLALFVVIILVIVDRIVAPLHVMTMAASALAAGDTDIDIGTKADGLRTDEVCTLAVATDKASSNEIRTLAGAFNRMIENSKRQLHIIEQIASGDPLVSVEMRSEKDLVNRALEKLNATIRSQAAAIREEHERIQLMLDATPLVSRLWNRNFQLIECNEAAVKLFGLKNKQEYMDRYFELSPEYQSQGERTGEKVKKAVGEAFEKGIFTSEWMYCLLDGTPVPMENTLVRVPYGDDYVVAAYSRDLRDQKKMMAEIDQRDNMLQTLNQAADILLRSEIDNFSGTLHQCMGMVTQAVNADRMHLFKNHTENGKLYCTQLYEWSEKAKPFQNTDIMTNVLYDEKTPKIKETLLRGECVHSLVRDMPPLDRAWLEMQGILSILVVPVFIRDEFWGFAGFDNCHSENLFSENEEFIMRSGCLLIANATLRNESVLKIRDTSTRLETALTDAKEANNAKSSFLAHMSHEIRTPLNAVIGFSELTLDEGNLNHGAASNVEKIYNAGSTILSIVNDILDISKIESGKFEIYPVQYDTPSLINDTVMLNIVRIGEKPIKFRLHVDENLPGTLYGDDIRVKQIFNNLLSNAFKYTDAGTVDWRIGFEKDERDSIWLVSSVEDTGAGMREEALKKLFSDYNQVDAKINRKAGGTGLGLAITKNLTEMMGGSITVESEYGKGTVFSVRLRQELISDTPIGKEVADNLMSMHYTLSRREGNTKHGRVNLSYAHVLVVDDVVTNLDVVKGMMKPYKVKIDCAMSGRQAIEMIRKENPRYSAIFMDHMMPGMDGIEATRIIREEIGTDYARNIPIIALTANAIVGNEAIFLSRGFQDFISKPIDMTKLDSVLRNWVRNKDLEKESPNVEEDTLPESGGDSVLKGITINGVDKNRALENFGGDENILIDVLRSYAVSTRPVLNNMREYLADGNLADYAIIVHGIKGTSYGIFAQQAGDAARELETAAKAGNLDAVKAGHAAFVNTMETLLDKMDETLARIDAATNKPSAAAPDPAVLGELREACAAFDMDRVDKAMTQLESFRYESGAELVAWLHEQVTNMTFEEISNGEWPSE